MFKQIMDFIGGLKNAGKPVVSNFRPVGGIVPASWYENCRPWKGIVVHHSATVDGKTNDWAAIRKYHTSYRIDGVIVDEATFSSRQLMGSGKTFEKPWSDIGYHGGWELDGDVYVFKMGRSWATPGAHAGLKGNNSYNSDYLGFCVVGNFDKLGPSAELWGLCLKTIREVKRHFGFGNDKILGHREVYDRVGVPRQKTCPGNMFDMDKLRASL